MSEQKDLTRWNRAGLKRFRYVNGNAAEYLDTLRQQLVDQFKDPQTQRCEWLNPAEKIPANEEKPESETLIQRQERLSLKQKRILEMYHQDRRDWAWEITRTFARSCHILTEYANAYANEGYLGTATQWDHVRRLVEMLDYHPAPPASASTRLAFVAKEDRKGILAKGFQVKHSPITGGAKVIFETLEDLFIDPALNELRPRGWDKSEDPVVELPDDNGTSPSAEEQQFSAVANGPAINLQGVGEVWALQLNTLTDNEYYKINDFLNLDPEDSGVEIGAIRLREFKAKAEAISNFELESGWSDIANWFLPRIALENPESLAEITGNTLDKVEALQLRIELIGAYLDNAVYENTKLKDLLKSASNSELVSISIRWVAKKKPKVESDEVAMVMHGSKNIAEAVMIESVEEISAENTMGEEDIVKTHLLPSPKQFNWGVWPKGKLGLHFSPRWKRECWLNNEDIDVVRTEEPHGLSAGSYICWRVNSNKDQISEWKFAKVIEVDKRDLRLEVNGRLPQKHTKIFVARPLEGPNLPADIEKDVGLSTGEKLAENDMINITPKDLMDDKITPNFPLVVSAQATDAVTGLIPGLFGKLPGVGSFIVPTPMLPMDLVKAAVKMLLKLGAMVIPSTGKLVFEFVEPATLADEIYDLLSGANVTWDDDEATVKASIISMLTQPGGSITLPSASDELVLFKKVAEEILLRGPFLIVPKDPPVKAVIEASDPLYMFNGMTKIQAGDWVVARFTYDLRALKVLAINEFIDSDKTETFSLSFKNLSGNEGALEKVYADFRGELVPENATVNMTPLESEQIELEEVPESLKIGRTVLLTGCGKEPPVAAKIESIDGNVIKTNPSAVGCTKGNLIIRGNVVLASHGEVKPEKILGSGNAAKTNQEFTLEVEQVSFVPDATMHSGVAAAIEVEVAGRVWEQVSTLKDSAPGDHHYAIRMTEEGYVKILFGDGEYGRRLPTGKNNIRVRYRVGSGLAGNVPTGSLEKPVNPHPLIKAVSQPLQAVGGGDMEDVASLRENAPPTLLALERAVSLSDFSHLAAGQSSIWQAKAYSQILHGGRTESVKVVVVPAGGVVSEGIKSDMTKFLQKFLQKHALPGINVEVMEFSSLLFDMKVTVRIKTNEFLAEEVEKTIAFALADHFTLKNRKLGEHLYLSEVYKVVESVQGVENSICVLNGDSNLQLIRADNESTVVYLDTEADENPSTLEVTHEEYQP